MKTYILMPLFLLMTGCSHFSVNTSHCDQVMLNDPNSQNIPQECRDYKSEDADKSTYPPGQRPEEIGKDFEIGK